MVGSEPNLATFTEADLTDDWEVTVCDACKEASCWLGIIMCDRSRDAGTRKLPVRTLRQISQEHPSWWAAEARARVGAS